MGGAFTQSASASSSSSSSCSSPTSGPPATLCAVLGQLKRALELATVWVTRLGGVGSSGGSRSGGSRSGGVGGSSSGGVGAPLDDGWDTFGGRCAPRLRAAAPPLLYNFLMCPSACLSSVPFFFCVPASKSPWSSVCRLQSNSKRRVRPPL